MTTSCPEEYLNVYWKIKNFSFCRYDIESPKFNLCGWAYTLFIKHDSDYVEFHLRKLMTSQPIRKEISILTCDDTPPETVPGDGFMRMQKYYIFQKRRNSFLPGDTLTLRYRFQTSDERGQIFFCSEIGVKRKFFLWRHDNISSLQRSEAKLIENSERYGEIKLTLESTDGLNTDKHLLIEVSRKRGERCYCILKVSVLDLNGTAVNEISDDFYFQKKDDVFNQQTEMFTVPFKMDKLLACKDLLLPGHTLTLKCNFAMSMGSLTDQTSVTNYTADFLSVVKVSNDPLVDFKEKRKADFLSVVKVSNDPLVGFKEKNDDTVADLRADLNSILDDGTLFDATLVVGEEVIKAHKTILSARSPVFRAMFTKNMKENINSIVVIEDLDAETVRRLLLYIYTDSIREDQWEKVKKLYFAADKYELMGLKKKCGSFLKTNLTVSNVCEILLLADLHQDDSLKTAALDFFFEHDFAVFSTDEWKMMEEDHSTLAFQVMRELYSKK